MTNYIFSFFLGVILGNLITIMAQKKSAKMNNQSRPEYLWSKPESGEFLSKETDQEAISKILNQ